MSVEMRALSSALIPALIPALLAVSLAVTAGRAAAQAEPTHRFKLRAPGWEMPESAWTGRIPFRKPYHELTDAQKAVLNQAYESMGPGDEPPFPARGLQAITDLLIRAHQHLGGRGDLDLVVDVDAGGEVQAVTVIKSPSDAMTRFAANALMLTPLKPARCGGEPCSQQFPVRVEFRPR